MGVWDVMNRTLMTLVAGSSGLSYAYSIASKTA